MSVNTKTEYFWILKERYQRETSKKERSKIVDEACLNTGLHRKSVIRALNTLMRKKAKPKRSGRPKKFTNECVALLKRLYRESEYQCSDKLKVMIPVLLEQYSINLLDLIKEEIKQMSPASIDRYLKSYRRALNRKRRSSTRPGSRIFKKVIPLKTLTLIARQAGYLEADTVAHCGGSLSGEYIYSLTVTDAYTGWTENRACMGKSAKNVLPLIKCIHFTLPFETVSINFDNGTEFLNSDVYGFYQTIAAEAKITLPMTRSRSYHKNDNARVEQKNWTHVRQLFGYDRFEFKELLPLMNEIYTTQSLVTNFFIPQFKLTSKVRIESKIKKKYDAPKTPYERLLEDPHFPQEKKERLKELYQTLNYPYLKAKKQELIASFLKLHEKLKLGKGPTPNQEPGPVFGNTYL